MQNSINMKIKCINTGPRRILVRTKSIMELLSQLANFQDDIHTESFQISEEYPISCVNVSNLHDKVIWGYLNGRKVVSPLIKREDLPEYLSNQKTNWVTLVFKKYGESVNVFAAYYGEKTPLFPDDRKCKNKEEAKDFWQHNALIIRCKDSYEESEKPDWANWNPQLSMHGAESFRTVFSLVNNRIINNSSVSSRNYSK